MRGGKIREYEKRKKERGGRSKKMKDRGGVFIYKIEEDIWGEIGIVSIFG
ncbi:hypothetical protein TUM17572_57870 [Klebsiella oxytoca]|nr:hypothetical protein TUM17572_57870 [Klebsiella oxytoca]